MSVLNKNLLKASVNLGGHVSGLTVNTIYGGDNRPHSFPSRCTLRPRVSVGRQRKFMKSRQGK